MSKTVNTILTTEKFEVKITKEEIAETVTAELENNIYLRLEQIEIELKANDKKIDNFCQEVVQFREEKEEKIKALFAEEIVSLDRLGLEIFISWSSTDFSVKVKSKQYSATTHCEVYKPHEAALKPYLEEYTKFNEKDTKRREVCSDERSNLITERNQLNAKIRELPRYQRYIKSQLTKKALSTSEEGREIMTIIGKSLPFSLPTKNLLR